jgi:hypothetical protein
MGQPHSALPRIINRYGRKIWLFGALALYLALAAYQLGLPGLHYDEAREAGVNAMELLTGAPVTAFRGITVNFFGWHLPLMVQDYIGALNIYLALPFLALTGMGVPNLRVLSVLTGLAALLLLERAVSEYCELADWTVQNPKLPSRPPRQGSSVVYVSTEAAPSKTSLQATPSGGQRGVRFNRSGTSQNLKAIPPISLAGGLTVTLLAASPSFVFWSRQGIFVTNLTQPLSFWCIWQGLHWLRTSRTRALMISAFAGGLAIYTKLIAIWVIGPFALLMASWWVWQQVQQWTTTPARQPTVPALSLQAAFCMLFAFVLPLSPLLLFYMRTGAVGDILHKLDQSYYGVNNRDLLPNLAVRWGQLLQSLRGDHLWYLGGIYGNHLASWLAGIAILVGLRRDWRMIIPWLVLLVLIFVCSLFTISNLFVTHYALVQPLVVAVVGVALSTWLRENQKSKHPVLRFFALWVVLLWLGLDLTASLRYHAALRQSGGLGDHSDATYHLAYYLRYHGEGAPIALDWGLDAPVRYLSQGAVTPIEIFGYASPRQPDAAFAQRLRPFLANPNNVYLLHAPDQTIFAGRRELFVQMTKTAGLRLVKETQFSQRDNQVLFELWRVVP